MILKIKEAIDYYNENRERGEPRLTQKFLGEIVLQDQTQAQAEFYISKWCKGEQLSKLKPNHVVLICLKTGVDPNTLFDWESVKKNEKLLNDGK